jgi:hypothetical protein
MNQKFRLVILLFLVASSQYVLGSGQGLVKSSEGDTQIFTNRYFANQNLAELMRQADGRNCLRMEFQRCTFQGSTSMSSMPNAYQSFPAGLFFRDCTFEGELNLQSIHFTGQLDFNKCQFKKDLIARNAVFTAPLAFRECGIDGEAVFQNCLFMKESTWIASYFYKPALFQGSRFMKPAQFQSAHFMANADFNLCRFEEGGAFDGCVATGKFDFNGSRQDGLMTFRKAILQKGLSMNKFRSFAPLKFIDTKLEDSLHHRDFRWFAEVPEVQGVQGSGASTVGF